MGEAPDGVGATGSADTTAPRIMRSIASGELVSIVPLVTKSTTHRVVRMDEMPGIRIDLQYRPVTRIRHAGHKRRNNIASKVGQSIEGGAWNERLLVRPRARAISRRREFSP